MQATAIPYWIQRADFSATDYGPVGVADGIRAFETHDWRRELDHYSELESAGTECCPPGIVFADPSGDVLHVCPGPDGRAMVHYHFPAARRLLGLIPLTRSKVETKLGVHRPDVASLIRFFFEGRRDWMLQKLSSA